MRIPPNHRRTPWSNNVYSRTCAPVVSTQKCWKYRTWSRMQVRIIDKSFKTKWHSMQVQTQTWPAQTSGRSNWTTFNIIKDTRCPPSLSSLTLNPPPSAPPLSQMLAWPEMNISARVKKTSSSSRMMEMHIGLSVVERKASQGTSKSSTRANSTERKTCQT